MAGGLASLGQIGSGFAGALPDSQLKWLQVQRAKQELAQIEQQLQAQGAAGSAFGGQPGPPQGMPQQGPLPPPPGQASQPAPPPPQQGMPPAPPPRGSAPMGQPGAPPGQAMSAPGVNGGGMAPGGAPQGGFMTIDQLADRIRQRNPGIDNRTLFAALAQAQPLMAPQDRLLMQQTLGEMKMAAQSDRLGVQQALGDARIKSAEDIAKLKGDIALSVAGSRNATNITIADKRADTASNVEAGRTRRFDAGEAGKNLREDKRLWSQADRQAKSQTQKEALGQYNLDARQLSAIVSQLNSLQQNAPDDPEIGKLRVQRDAIVSRMTATRTKNPFLPPAAQAAQSFKPDTGYGDEGGGAARDALPEQPGVTSGQPKPGDVVDGYRFKGGDPGNQASWEKVQ